MHYINALYLKGFDARGPQFKRFTMVTGAINASSMISTVGIDDYINYIDREGYLKTAQKLARIGPEYFKKIGADYFSCIACHAPVEDTDWVYVYGYKDLKGSKNKK